MTLRALVLATMLAVFPAWAPARAHTASPDTVVAAVAKTDGVDRAARDEANPRVLVVRVGEKWFDLPEETRRELAARWRDEWRESVEQGVVSVLDARTEAPVVRFGAGGRVFVAPGGAVLNLRPGSYGSP